MTNKIVYVSNSLLFLLTLIFINKNTLKYLVRLTVSHGSGISSECNG